MDMYIFRSVEVMFNSKKRIVSSLACLLLIHFSAKLLALPVVHNNASSSIVSLEEVIVTAQHREQNVHDIPVAVSVLSSDLLLRSGTDDLLALFNHLPSINSAQYASPVATTFAIRGLGTSASNAGLEPSVGIFIDDVYLSRPANALSDLQDVQRIEVLRGPQSTLFGKNTSAGVVSIITQPPEKVAKYKLRLNMGNYQQRKLQASATGPLNDQLSYRLSASTHKRDGFYEKYFR